MINPTFQGVLSRLEPYSASLRFHQQSQIQVISCVQTARIEFYWSYNIFNANMISQLPHCISISKPPHNHILSTRLLKSCATYCCKPVMLSFILHSSLAQPHLFLLFVVAERSSNLTIQYLCCTHKLRDVQEACATYKTMLVVSNMKPNIRKF